MLGKRSHVSSRAAGKLSISRKPHSHAYAGNPNALTRRIKTVEIVRGGPVWKKKGVRGSGRRIRKGKGGKQSSKHITYLHEIVKVENTLQRIKGILVYRTIIKVIRVDQI